MLQSSCTACAGQCLPGILAHFSTDACTEAAPSLRSEVAPVSILNRSGDFKCDRSKACHSFQTKMNYFLDDIELVDVVRESILHDDLTGSSRHVLDRVDPQRHPHLQRRGNSAASRKHVINHLRNTVYGSFMKDTYEEITQYLRTILRQCTQSGFDSDRIIGEHAFKIDARTVLQMGNWETVCENVAVSLFQAMENERSTRKLLRKMCSKLDLSVPACLIDDIIPYIEVRHLLVHSDGLASEEFRRNNEGFSYTDDGKVRLDYRFVSDCHSKSFALIEAFDDAVIANNLLAEEYMQP